MSGFAAPTPPLTSLSGKPVRVMIVDDAVVVRGLLSRWMAEAGGIEIASTHRTGAEAVSAIEHIKPDVVLLDIEMPDMDGITALPLLLKKWPSANVIIASTLTTRNADISLQCLSLGAIDYIAKPSTNRDVTFSTDFRREIIDKVKTLGRLGPARLRRPATKDAAGNVAPLRPLPGDRPAAPATPVQLRPFNRAAPRILTIGASTGGPNALTELLRACRPTLQKMPIVIAQHMPTMFTSMFAEHIRRQLAVDACEAQNGEMVDKGRIYVAPGGKHVRLERVPAGIKIVVDDSAPVNFCKPSVDVAMLSVAHVFGPGALGVMLTGMGSDGLRGATDIVERGGNVLAQDEASSVVWGMPGAVAKRGICAAVEPIDGLARIINRLSQGEQP
ncbi:MAG: protein-glutamate methylesterase/protein-glutamine glutaminase [Beijerinckiaceae bacterium]